MSSAYREGILTKNDIGRWEYDGCELMSGDTVEVFAAGTWLRGRIEYLHGSQEYALIIPSGLDRETFLVLHAGIQARQPTSKSRSGYP